MAMNWNDDKRRRYAAEMAWEAKCRQPAFLLAWSLRCIATCRACGHVADVDLQAVVDSGCGQQDISWTNVGLKCPECGDVLPEVRTMWDGEKPLIDPPRGWQPPIAIHVLQARAEAARARAMPQPMPDGLNYTFCQAIARGWGVAGNCRVCGVIHKLSDKALAERFLAHMDRPLSHLKGRLKCDCGRKDLVIYPYQAGAMNWTGLSVAAADVLAVIAEKERILRERAATLSGAKNVRSS